VTPTDHLSPKVCAIAIVWGVMAIQPAHAQQVYYGQYATPPAVNTYATPPYRAGEAYTGQPYGGVYQTPAPPLASTGGYYQHR